MRIKYLLFACFYLLLHTISFGACTATLTAGTATICAGSSDTLTVAGALGGPTYEWKAAGTVVAGQTNATYKVSPVVTTIYTAIITNATGCPTDSLTTTITVNAAPSITSLSATPSTICSGDSSSLAITASAGSGTITSYTWNLALGNVSSANVAPATNTTYQVTVTNSNGCSASASVTVTPVPAVQTPVISAAGVNGQCGGRNQTFTVTNPQTGVTYSWNFGDGHTANGNPVTTQFPHGHGNSSTNYTVSVTATYGSTSCTSSASVSVGQKSLPDDILNDLVDDPQWTSCSGLGSILVSDTATTAFQNYYIYWGDSTTYNSSSPPDSITHTYALPGYYNVTYTVTSTDGCTESSNYTVYIGSNPHVGLIEPGATISLCTPITLSFPVTDVDSNTAGTIYIVNSNDGSQIDTLYSPPTSYIHTFTTSSCGYTDVNGDPNSFYVQITATNPCSYSHATVDPITTNALPVADFTITPDSIDCTGTNVTITNTSSAGDFVSNSGNCDSTMISQWAITPTTGYTLTGNLGASVWPTYSTGNEGSAALNLNFTVPGTYSVKLTVRNKSTCGYDTITKQICIQAPPTPLFTATPTLSCFPLVVNFTDASITSNTCGSLVRTWIVTQTTQTCIQDSANAYEFTSGTSASSVNPVITFNNSGVYSVYLRMVNICGTFNSAPQTFTVYRRPQFSVSTQNICITQTETPIATVLVCGDSANTYSWSFTGATPTTSTSLSPGAISYAVTGTYPVSLTVTNECGTTQLTSDVIVTSPSTVVLPPNDTVCLGTTIPATNFSSLPTGATFAWTNSNTAIGLAASGTGNVPTFTATNTGTTILTSTITVTPTIDNCPGLPGTYTITVYPNPTVTPPANFTVCPGVSVAATSLTVNPAGTVFTWTNSNTAIGLGASGAGNVPAFTSTNAGITVISGTITLSPSINGCPGPNSSYVITVNVQPTVTVPANITDCPGIAVAATTFTSIPTGATYTWTNSNTAIGLAASGVTSVPAFTTTNASNVNISGTITGTPTLNGCSGPPATYVITVNAKPTVNLPNSDTLCPATFVAATTFSSTPTGATYTWANSNTAIGLVATGSGNVPAFTTTNATTAAIIGTITVTPTLAGCVGTPSSYKHTINPTPSMTTPASVSLCSGASTTTTAFVSTPAGATFNWTNNNTSIGLAASGSGNIAAFTVTNSTNASVVATITVIPVLNGCPGTPVSYTITVKPLPTVTLPASDTICPGVAVAAVTLVSNPVGSTFAWTNSNTAIGLAATGTGNISAYTSANTTTLPIVGTITVTPTINGCAGPASHFITTVNPKPTVAVPASFSVCAGSAVAATSFTSNPTGATFSWTNSNTNIGLAANGAGNVPGFTSTNGGSTAITGTITVTPFLNGCTGTSSLYVITVSPLPAVNAVANITECAGVSVAALTFTSTPAGATYTWTNSNTAIGLAANGTGGLPAYTSANSTTSAITATITVTPTTGTCVGPPLSFTITVNPLPVLTPLLNDTVCPGTALPVQVLTSTPSATSYAWTNTNTAIGLAATGTGNVSAFTSANATTATITGTIKVTPTLNGCVGSAVSYNVLVYPKPVATVPANVAVCPGATIAASAFVSTPAGATFNWTSSNTLNGLASAGGTGNVPSYTGINATNAALIDTITLTPSLNGCPGATVHYTTTVNALPAVTVPASDTICPGVSVAAVTLASVPAGATYTWTNTNTAIGLAASGTVNIPAFTSTNTTIAPISGTITVIPTLNGCVGPSSQYTITVSLSPSVAVPASFTVCAGSAVAATSFTSTPAGATYTWTNTNTAIGLAASGTGNVPGFNSTNSGTTAITGTIKVTPNLNGCAAGTSSSYVITVNPLPSVNAVANITECAGVSVAALNFTSNPAGATCAWTNSNTAIGLAASGTGGLPAYISTNSTTTAISATITVTPTIGTCIGPPLSFTINVNPIPVLNPLLNDTVCPGTTVPVQVLTSTPTASSYAWTNTNTAIGLAATGTGNVSAFTAANATAATITGTIKVTPSLNGCAGSPVSYNVLVYPKPVVTTPANVSSCPGLTVAASNFTSNPAGATFSWSSISTANGLDSVSGPGNVPSFTAINATSAAIVNTITVTPSLNGCTGAPVNYTITVNPLPTVNVPASGTICPGVAVPAATLTSVPAGATFAWTNSNTAIGLVASGTGNVSAYTSANATAAAIAGTITVTATLNGCTGPSSQYTTTVNPAPTVTVPANFTVCTGSTVAATVFTSNPAGATYTWTNTNTAMGLAASGNGDVPGFTSTNTNSTSITGTIKVTPTLNGCAGISSSYIITVSPQPNINPVANVTECAGVSVPATTFTSTPAGATYAWTNSDIAIGLAANGTGGLPAYVSANPTIANITATITVTPSIGTCVGPPYSFTITVKPSPVVNLPANDTVCYGTAVPTAAFTSIPAGATYSWVNNNPAIGLATSGAGNVPGFTAANVTNGVLIATITVTPTLAACVGSPGTYTIAVNPSPTVTVPASFSVCAGAAIAPTNFTSTAPGSIFTWTNSNPNIGVAASGTGNLPAFTATNTTSGILSGTITVTPSINGCGGTPVSYVITVKPTPVVTLPGNDTICKGILVASTVFSSVPPGASYTWTNSNTAIGVGANGTGNLPGFTAANSTNAPIDATITVIPTVSGCPGLPESYTIQVNPLPAVTVPASFTVCQNVLVPASNFTSTIANTTFTWTNSNTGIGLPASGNGNTPAFTAANPTINTESGTIIVAPTAGGCPGSSANYVITVKPAPHITATADADTLCSSTLLDVVLSSSIPGALISWTVNAPAGISGATPGNGDSIQQVLANGSGVPQPVQYVIASSSNGCSGLPDTVNVVVNPGVILEFSTGVQTICSGQATQAVYITSSVPGTPITWTSNASGVTGVIASGTDSIPAQTLVNNTSFGIVVDYNFVAGYPGCQNTTATYDIIVNPPATAIQQAAQTICSGSPSQPIVINSNAVGVNYDWIATSPDGITGFVTSDTSTIIASQTYINPSTTAGIVVYTISPAANGCPGQSVNDTITVKPSPAVNPIPDQVICSGSTTNTIYPSATLTGTVFNWSLIYNGNITGYITTGTDSIPSQTLSNPGLTTDSVVYNIEPSNNGCNGPSYNAVVVVNPFPDVILPADQSICSGDTSATVALSSHAGGATFAWTAAVTAGITGYTASGAGNITTQTLLNSTNTSGTVTYTITASANGCVGAPFTYVITVKPIPTAIALPDTICSAAQTNVPITSNINDGAFTWTVNMPAGITGGTSGSGTDIQESLISTSASAQSVLYIIIPSSLGCVGPADSVYVVVNPSNNVQFSFPNQTICSGQSTQSVTISGSNPGGTFPWTSQPNGVAGVTASGTDSIPAQTLINTTGLPLAVIYTVSFVNGSCPTNPANYEVVVNPTPVANQSASQTVCSGIASQVVTLTSNVNGAIFSWSGASPDGVTGFTANDDSTDIIPSQILTNTSAAEGIVIYTITPTSSGCPGLAVYDTIFVSPLPVINPVAAQTICSGSPNAVFNPSSSIAGTTFSWSVIYYGNITGYTSSGTGSIPADTLINSGVTADSVLYDIAPVAAGCTGLAYDYKIIVNPGPDILLPPAQTICSGSATDLVTLSSDAGAATFSWTATATANVTGFTASGTGNIPAQTIGNSGTTAGVVTYAITAFANGCNGLVYNYDVTVKPLPVVTALPSPDTICSSTQTSIALSSTIANTSFSWTATEPANVIGANPGTGEVIQQVLLNNNAAPQTVTYTVVPNAIGCPGAPLAVNVVVNPVPDVLFNPSPQSVCSGQATQLVNITSITTGATFTWTSQANGVAGIAASGTNTIPVQTPVNSGTGYDTALYFVTASYLNCPGLSATYAIVVNPAPQVILPAAQVACPGVPTNPVVLNSAPTGATFAWTGSSPDGITGFSPSGTGSPIPAQTLSNSGSTAGSVIFSVTASANGCSGPAVNYTITVNALPLLILPQPQTICSGASFAAVTLSSDITGATFTWTSSANVDITGNLASGNGNISSQTLSNSGNLPDTVTYVVVPLANGCTGVPSDYYVTVEPVPAVIFAPQPQTICSGKTSLPVAITSTTPGGSIVWNAVVPNDITGAVTSGTNTIPAQTLFNSLVDTFPVDLTVTYTAVATTATSGCPGLPANYTITVEPLPVISFNQTVTNGCSPLSVDFMPATMNYGIPDTLVFNWGDGSANTTIYPSGVAPQWYPVNHTFYNDSTIPLTFNITLIAHSLCADTAVVQSVYVLPNSVSAFFTATPANGCAPLTVSLHDESTGPGTLSWCLNYNQANDSCMGPGRVDTMGTTFDYTFAAGTYTVALFVQNGYGCAHDSAFQTISVSPSPVADFAFANDSCAQTPVRFNNLSIIPPGTNVTEYDWNFGTGDTSLQTNPVYTFDSSGAYNVCLSVIIAGGCHDSICKPVNVLYKPVANFSNEDTCANTQPTIFVNSSVGASTYTWNFGDGNTSALADPDHYYSAAGNYQVTLISFTNSCSDTVIKPVSVYAVPVAAFTAPGPYTCGVPANLQLTNNSTGAVSYAWNFGNGTFSTDNNPVATYNAQGTYSITLAASTHLGCVDTVQQNVEIYAYPSLQSVNINPSQGCQPLYVQFAVNASDANSYLWNFGDGSPSITGQGATAHTYTDTGSYNVTLVMYSFGTCGDTVVLPDMVNVHSNPIANFEYDMNTTIDSAIGTVQFINTSTNSNSYVWSFGDGDSSSLVNPAHTYPGIDYFNVELLAINQYGCRDSIDKSVYVIKKSLYVPNAFAPEYTAGNSLVQVWKPAGMGLSSYHAQVFDKWGELLWESTAITNDDMKMPVEGWDGTYQGKLCQQDVYVWKVEAVFVDGTRWPGMSYKFQEEKKTIGSVTLIR